MRAPGHCEVSGQFNTDPWRLSESLGPDVLPEFRIFWILEKPTQCIFYTPSCTPPSEDSGQTTIQLITISSVKHMKINSK